MNEERAPARLQATAPALDDLAPLYRWALALDARGLSHQQMAIDLSVPVESVAPLLRLARAKAAAAAARDLQVVDHAGPSPDAVTPPH
jgi:orotate phosphoribosyltransferase-like protein